MPNGKARSNERQGEKSNKAFNFIIQKTMNLSEAYEKLKRGELCLGMYDPNGFHQYNSFIEDLLMKYRENLIKDISK